jgi:hypothetical protein
MCRVQEASHVASVVHSLGLRNIYVMRESGPTGKEGLLTTSQTKSEMAAMLQTALLEQSMNLATNLFTSNSDGVKSVLNCLRTQLLQYRSFSSEALGRNNAFSSKRLAFSGKCGADGRVVNTMQDDLCIALQICMFASALVAQRRTNFFPHDTIST